jgi:hypothetical protein
MKTAVALLLLAGTAFAEPPPLTRIDPPPGARAEALTATLVSATFLGAGIFSAVRAEQSSSEASDLFARNAPATDQLAAIDRADHWHDATYAFAALTVVSVVVTGVLWDRAQPHYQVVVAPGGGAVVGYATRF